jgi:hypothetical protein
MNSQNQPNIILFLIDAIIVCGNLTLNHREREEETVERNCMGRRKKQDEKIEQHHHTCVKKKQLRSFSRDITIEEWISTILGCIETGMVLQNPLQWMSLDISRREL